MVSPKAITGFQKDDPFSLLSPSLKLEDSLRLPLAVGDDNSAGEWNWTLSSRQRPSRGEGQDGLNQITRESRPQGRLPYLYASRNWEMDQKKGSMAVIGAFRGRSRRGLPRKMLFSSVAVKGHIFLWLTIGKRPYVMGNSREKIPWLHKGKRPHPSLFCGLFV